MLRQKLLLAATALALFLLSFSSYNRPSATARIDAQALYASFAAEADTLLMVSEAYQKLQNSQSSLKKALSETRLAYKRIAFLLEYYYPAFTEAHLNGAPLLHAEKYSTHSLVKPPKGLQVLDEMIFAEDAAQQRSEIAILCRELANKCRELQPELNRKTFLLEEVVEACRMELIRLFSMGMAGFDTPGSANALPEAASAIDAMRTVLDGQAILQDTRYADRIAPLLESARQQLLTSPDFNTFDRLAFLKAYINPLYQQLAHLQSDLGLEAAVPFPTGRNVQSANLFAPDFLDPYFYTELQRQEDNASLRTLGRQLFYDERLSRSGDMSCATCHKPELAFTDGLPKSDSNVKGETVLRNAPTLLNAVYADRFFYDMRAFTLEQQAEHVIYNMDEFNTEYEAILSFLNKDKGYARQFKAIFGRGRINRDRFAKALSSYVLSLQSFDSPFDQYVRGETTALSDEAKLGFNLFMGKAACGTCHFPPTFSGLMPPYYTKNESEILGVLQSPYSLQKKADPDPGRQNNGLHYEDVWIYGQSFRTPGLRNVEKTAPYFHNGAYPTLEMVLEFYNHGGGAGLGLDVPNQTLPPDALGLSPKEKDAIVAFLKSLTEVKY